MSIGGYGYGWILGDTLDMDLIYNGLTAGTTPTRPPWHCILCWCGIARFKTICKCRDSGNFKLNAPAHQFNFINQWVASIYGIKLPLSRPPVIMSTIPRGFIVVGLSAFASGLLAIEAVCRRSDQKISPSIVFHSKHLARL